MVPRGDGSPRGRQSLPRSGPSSRTGLRPWQREGIVPGLAIVRVGDDPASVSYACQKEKAALGLASSPGQSSHRRTRTNVTSSP